MPFQPCPGILQVEVVFGVNQEIAENVYHVMHTGAWTQAQLDAVSAAFRDVWSTYAKPFHGPATFQFKHILTDLTAIDGLRSIYSFATGNQGTAAGTQLPNNVAAAVKLDTGHRGRSQRGRVYWMGLTDAHVVADQLQPAFETGVTTFISNLKAEVKAAAGTGDLCVLSRYANKVQRPSGIGTPIIQAVFTDGYSDSQRRRLPGHNRHH